MAAFESSSSDNNVIAFSETLILIFQQKNTVITMCSYLKNEKKEWKNRSLLLSLYYRVGRDGLAPSVSSVLFECGGENLDELWHSITS